MSMKRELNYHMEESRRHRYYKITNNLPDIYIFICNALLNFTVQHGNRGRVFWKTHFSVGILWSHFPVFPDLLSSPPLTLPVVFTRYSSTWVFCFISVFHFASVLSCFIFSLSCPDTMIRHFNYFLPRKPSFLILLFCCFSCLINPQHWINPNGSTFSSSTHW